MIINLSHNYHADIVKLSRNEISTKMIHNTVSHISRHPLDSNNVHFVQIRNAQPSLFVVKGFTNIWC